MQEERAHSAVDAVRVILGELSTSSEPDTIVRHLARLARLLQRYPPAVPNYLVQTYRWLILKLDVLRDLIAHRSSPRLIRLVNDLAAELLLGLDGEPRHALRQVESIRGDLADTVACNNQAPSSRAPRATPPQTPLRPARPRAGTGRWGPA